MVQTKPKLPFGGIEYDEKRLEYVATEVAEEINVKKVGMMLDDGRLFVVEHDPVRKRHSCKVKTLKEMSVDELKGLLRSWGLRR